MERARGRGRPDRYRRSTVWRPAGTAADCLGQALLPVRGEGILTFGGVSSGRDKPRGAPEYCGEKNASITTFAGAAKNHMHCNFSKRMTGAIEFATVGVDKRLLRPMLGRRQEDLPRYPPSC